MAMTVMNNSAAMLSLGELNKNITEMGKRQKKLSSGMKINSAGDDASSYAISERMRAQLRSLDQDVDNVKKGTTLLNVAGGAIDNIVDELRNMKEMAINAANDHNTDQDRATLQKELEQKLANIDDIASTTNFNNKILLDGRYSRAGVKVMRTVVEPRSYPNVSGTGIVVENTVTGLFANSGLTQETAASDGKTSSSGVDWINGRQVLEGRQFGEYLLDFSSAVNANGDPLNLPDDLDGQGFYVVCAGRTDALPTSPGGSMPAVNDENGETRYLWCGGSHTFVFDKSIPFGTGVKVGTITEASNSHSVHTSYAIGIGGITDQSQLAQALFEGARTAAGASPGTSSVTLRSGDPLTFIDKGDGTYAMKRGYAMWIYEGYESRGDFPYPVPNQYIAVEETDYHPLVIHHGTRSAQRTNVYINDMRTKALKGDIPNQDDVERLEKLLPASSLNAYYDTLHSMGIDEPDGKIGILDGIVDRLVENNPQYASNSNYKSYMEYRDVIDVAKNTSTDKIKLTTQKDASVAIRVLDGALEYALDEATYVGAYINRFNFTEENLVTSNENTQSAESVIRDADMAKEMTNFTKSSILSQSAQAMLAQANQVGSQALSLLQQ